MKDTRWYEWLWLLIPILGPFIMILAQEDRWRRERREGK